MKKALVVGSLNMDFVISVPRRPQDGETIFGKGFRLVPGGKGANQAYALGKMGADTAMLGAVGTDGFGTKLLQNLESVGVHTESVLRLADSETGKAFIEVDEEGQNSIIVISGANVAFSPEHVLAKQELFDWADAVVMQLEVPVPVVMEAARLAKERGKLVILDPAPARADLPDELLALADIIKPNETELSILTGLPVTSREEAAAAARTLLKKGVGTVLVTLGSHGALLVQEAGEKYFPAQKVKAVDSTAAGDCFTAAFTRAFTGENFAEAIELASRAAAISVTRHGAQTSIPSFSELEG